MVVHLLVQKSSQNNSIKDELEEALFVVLEGAPKISFWEAKKIEKKKKFEAKDDFDEANLTMYSQVHLWISDLALYASIMFYTAQDREDVWHLECW